MASNPLFIIPDFFFHFPNELCHGYLRFEGNGKIPSNLSLENAKKRSGIMKSGLDAMPLFLLDDLLNEKITSTIICLYLPNI